MRLKVLMAKLYHELLKMEKNFNAKKEMMPIIRTVKGAKYKLFSCRAITLPRI